jgi:hypothetical protein
MSEERSLQGLYPMQRHLPLDALPAFKCHFPSRQLLRNYSCSNRAGVLFEAGCDPQTVQTRSSLALLPHLAWRCVVPCCGFQSASSVRRHCRPPCIPGWSHQRKAVRARPSRDVHGTLSHATSLQSRTRESPHLRPPSAGPCIQQSGHGP